MSIVRGLGRVVDLDYSNKDQQHHSHTNRDVVTHSVSGFGGWHLRTCDSLTHVELEYGVGEGPQ